LDVLMGQDHRSSLYYRDFVETFKGLKQEIEEEFGLELPAVIPLFQRHTQLMMRIRHFNDATLRGALAPLPRIVELVEIIQFHKWTQLPPLPTRYTRPIVPGSTNHQPAPPAFAPALPPVFNPAPAPA
jgi:hypothetical protein